MSLEANKIAAAILVGGMLTMSVGLVSSAIYSPGGGEGHGAEGHAAPAAAEGAAPAVETAPAGPAENAVAMIAAADPAAGEKISAKCKSCHTFTNGGKNGVGPNLWGVVGNHTAHRDDFKYSDAILALKHQWTFEELDKFLTKPKAYAPGTKMTFPGLPKAADRAALLHWLNTQSDAPLPMPQ